MKSRFEVSDTYNRFYDCVGCELAMVLIIVGVWFAFLEISSRMNRKWGENPKKWWKR